MRFLLIAFLLICPPAFAAPRNIATAPMAFFVDGTQPNDSGDGLTHATARKSYCGLLRSLYNDWDFRGFQPFMFVRSGVVNNEMCGTGGALVGTTAIIIAPYQPSNVPVPGLAIPAAPDFIRTCSYPGCGNPDTAPQAQWCDSFGDLAIQIYYNGTWASCNRFNMEGGGAIVLHNVATTDIFGPRSTFSGGGDKDSAILADGPAIITIENSPLVEGQFGYPVTCNRGCMLTISQTFELYYANIKGHFWLEAGSHASIGIGSYPVNNSIVTGQSVVSGYSSVSQTGVAPPSGWLSNNGMVCAPPNPRPC
jgi:hypothetical protein